MSAASSTLTFPIPTLSPLIGKPNNTTIKQLRKEVYTNAHAVPSPHGGGNHGHLGLLMSPVDYAVLVPATPFLIPPHHGPAPIHAAGATQFEIAETNHLYVEQLQERATANTFNEELKWMILEASTKIGDGLNSLFSRYSTIYRILMEKSRGQKASSTETASRHVGTSMNPLKLFGIDSQKSKELHALPANP
jgi:hypothetical protein